MVLRLSIRRYARSLEPLPEEIEVHGISKSVISERSVIGTQRRLPKLMRRDLSEIKDYAKERSRMPRREVAQGVKR